jgi:hypothetical protein
MIRPRFGVISTLMGLVIIPNPLLCLIPPSTRCCSPWLRRHHRSDLTEVPSSPTALVAPLEPSLRFSIHHRALCWDSEAFEPLPLFSFPFCAMLTVVDPYKDLPSRPSSSMSYSSLHCLHETPRWALSRHVFHLVSSPGQTEAHRPSSVLANELLVAGHGLHRTGLFR